MQRHTVIMKLKPDQTERYIQLHKAIPPEVVEIGRQAGLRNYSIHCVGCYLFSYFEYTGTNYARDMEWKNAQPTIRAWQAQTASCFAPVCETELAVFPTEIFYNSYQ